MEKQKKLPLIIPGEILLEEFLKPLNMNAHQLALALRVPANRITGIIDGKRAISGDSALRLARYFGISAKFWINLQSNYELRKAEDEFATRIAREVQPRQRKAA
jgi:addiction module HigA family antidote